MQNDTSPVDEIPPLGKMATPGLQHVLIMYVETIAIPMILGNSMGLSLNDIALLINANLLICGVATLIQTIGFWKFGARIPLIQRCSFIALTSMIIIGHQYGITYIFGAVIACGALTILIAPVFSRLLRFFPPVVIGSLIMIIGISLIPAAARWLGGGNPAAADFGSLPDLGLGLATMIITLTVYVLFSGFMANSSILIGLVGGTLIALITGQTDFSSVSTASWFALIKPFEFGLPQFSPAPIILMFIAMIIIMAETTNTSMETGKLIEQKITPETLASTFRSNGLSTMLGGIFNSFPCDTFMQNTGFTALTGVKSRHVVACSGLILILLGSSPKLAAIIAALPPPVPGGVFVIMFGMVTITGVRQLARVRYEGTRNTIIVAVSLGVGLLPMSFPTLFSGITGPFKIIVGSGTFMGAFTAVILNALLNGPKSKEKEHILKENADIYNIDDSAVISARG